AFIWAVAQPTCVGLAVMVQEVLMQDPHSGALFAFKGKRGDLIKLLWWDGQGLCLFAKRLEKGRFIWPMAATGTVSLSAAQLAMLLEGIDWRAPVRSWHPQLATGEHWYGTRALERKLIDIIQTSDDYLLAASKDRDIFEVHYKRRRPLRERLASGIRAVVKGVSGERWQDRMLP